MQAIGFTCFEAVLFTWIFLSTAFFAAFLPADSYNPWALLSSSASPRVRDDSMIFPSFSELTQPPLDTNTLAPQRKLLRFVIQLCAAATVGFWLPELMGGGVRQTFPQGTQKPVRLCFPLG